jgi:hypothetical protein
MMKNPGFEKFETREGWQDNNAPIQIIEGERKEIVDTVEDVLIRKPRGVFVRGGVIVRIDYIKMKTWDERDVEVQAIVECGNEFLTETIGSICQFVKYDAKSKRDKICDPPGWIARTLKERKSRLKLPVLNGVTNCPILRSNGDIVTTPGYHQETGLFFDPRGASFPAIPDAPTKDDAGSALARIKTLFHTFPFVDNASRSIALSLLLTTVARRALNFAPAHAFDSPTAGTGKSMLGDIVAIITTGYHVGVIRCPNDPDEFAKHLSAILMRGVPLVIIDNCDGPLRGELLNQALSQEIVECRILGKTDSVPVRSNATFVANGNNLVIEGDMTRRSICGRMDAGVERPELLKFNYAPLEDAKANRTGLVSAALTILRAFHIANRPSSTAALGGFEHWSHLIRSGLIWLGEADPVETMEEIRLNDPKLGALKAVMLQWWKTWGFDAFVSVASMIETADDPAHVDLGSALLGVAGYGKTINNDRLGKWLGRMKDRIVTFENETQRSSVKIVRGRKSNGYQLWALTKVKEKPDGEEIKVEEEPGG